jgi:hypothetical protein
VQRPSSHSGSRPERGPDPGEEALPALGDEASLAETRLADDDHDTTCSAHGEPDGVAEQRALGLPADQRCLGGKAAAPRLADGSRQGPNDVGPDERLGCRREVHLLGRAPLEDALGRRTNRRAGEQGARIGHRLERGRRGDDLADGSVVAAPAGCDSTDNRRPGLRPDADRQLRARRAG